MNLKPFEIATFNLSKIDFATASKGACNAMRQAKQAMLALSNVKVKGYIVK